LLYSFLHELIPFILRCKGSEFHGGGLWAQSFRIKIPSSPASRIEAG